MKYTISFIGLLISMTLFGQSPANDPHWIINWQDEFNTSPINLNKWHVEHMCDGVGQPQLYLSNNVVVNNGNLVITVKEQFTSTPNSPCANDTHNYTSGMVWSKEAYNTQYGYFEAKIKLPYGFGFFPAFWVYLGDGITNNISASEIDIFEMLGALPSSSLTTNVHHDYCSDSRPDYNISTGSCSGIPDNLNIHYPPGFSWNNDWHIYAIEWNPSEIVWYLDGAPIRTYRQTGQIDPVTGQPIYPMDPVKVFFNMAILSGNLLPNSTTPFPSNMYVDYVRVYKLNNDCNIDLTACNYNFSNHDNKVKKSITIGTGGCSNTLLNGDNVYMRASEGILINGNFDVPIGAQLYLDVDECY
jgi:beta-glucanase (GH16 family)